MSTANRKSVLFIGAFPKPAALQRFVSGDLAGRLFDRGWKVSLTARHPNRLIRFGQLLTQTLQHARHCDVACVDVFSGAAFVWAEMACAILRRARKPHVLTLHGGNLPDFSRRNPTRVKRLLASAAAVTCPSDYLIAEMQHFRPELVLIRNGMDLSRYRFRERRPPFKTLTWLRAFHEIYNPIMAIEVLAALRQDHSLSLIMIGPDKGDGSFEKARSCSARLGLEPTVAFRGPIAKETVPMNLAEGDVFLNTTNIDNTPVSVLEALACGLPVVSTNVGGIPYLLTHDKSALLVEPNDSRAMAAAVDRILREPQLASRLSRDGHAEAERYDWSALLPKWERLLNEVTGATRQTTK